jgi:putative membrane protein
MVAWTLVFHLIGLVFWLGSLLVVTQVLAIHTEEISPEVGAALGRLETQLLKGLAHPGAALMVITGIILVSRHPEYLREQWLHFKLLLVVILILLDLRVYFRTRSFQAGKVQLRRGECMAFHGAIALVFFGILILVLVKPFRLPTRRTSSQLQFSGEATRGYPLGWWRRMVESRPSATIRSKGGILGKDYSRQEWST